MKDFKTKSKIKKVVVQPFFCFEFDHMPSDQEIKEELLRSVKEIEFGYKNIACSIDVSYEQEHKGNFWDDINKKFYKWNDLMELRNEKS